MKKRRGRWPCFWQPAMALAQNTSCSKPAFLMEGLSNLHHPVSTKNAEAQQFFDQGLRLVYAFNHDEAARSFHRAAELDPKLAMAWWGVALAVGPNYNLPVDPEHEKMAVEPWTRQGPEHRRVADREGLYRGDGAAILQRSQARLSPARRQLFEGDGRVDAPVSR